MMLGLLDVCLVDVPVRQLRTWENGIGDIRTRPCGFRFRPDHDVFVCPLERLLLTGATVGTS